MDVLQHMNSKIGTQIFERMAEWTGAGGGLDLTFKDAGKNLSEI